MSKGKKLAPIDVGFHGTDQDFTGPGISGHILPTNLTGKKPQYGISDRNLTYFAPTEEKAWQWAGAGGNNSPGRKRVHQTTPEKDQWADANLSGDWNREGDEARVTPSQTITNTAWAPPASIHNAFSSVHQTLPHINWTQFGGENYVTHNPQMNQGVGTDYTDSDKQRAGGGLQNVALHNFALTEQDEKPQQPPKYRVQGAPRVEGELF